MTYGDPSSATRTDCDEDMRPLQRGDGRHVTTRGRVVHAVGWSRRGHLSLCAVRTKRARRRQGETRRRTWAATGGHHACRLIAITTWNRGHPVRRSTSCESYPRDGGITTSVRERVSLLSAGLHAPSISTARTPKLSCAPETTSRHASTRTWPDVILARQTTSAMAEERVMRPAGIEPATSRSGGARSIP